MNIRRVATAHDKQGKAMVGSDETVMPTTSGLMLGYFFHQLWATNSTAAFPDDGLCATGTYFPPVGGTRFLMFTVPPTRLPPDPSLDLGLERQLTEEKLPGLLGLMEPDNPGMHRSDTLDFIYVLEGEIWLELDDGREVLLTKGDSAVQNGTRHAWRNKGVIACKMLVCMTGAHRNQVSSA